MPPHDHQAPTPRPLTTADIALQFGLWLDGIMKAQDIRNFELVEMAARIGGTFKPGHVNHWRNGDNTAAPKHAIIIARALGLDPVEALRAAGHDPIADEMERRGGREATTPKEREKEFARQWSDWIHQVAPGGDISVLVDASHGDISQSDVAEWTIARHAATSTAAALAAKLLGADPFEALRHSGHGPLADEIQAINAMLRETTGVVHAHRGDVA